MQKKYRLTFLAKQNLEDIFDYTVETWGAKKAKTYIKQLYTRFEWLSVNHQLGINRNDVEADCKSYFEGSHSIFYQVKDGFIEILGVFHQHEDVKRRFDGS